MVLRRVRVLVALAVGSLAACSLFVPFADYDREYGLEQKPRDADDADTDTIGEAEARDAGADTRDATCDVASSTSCGACDHDCLGKDCSIISWFSPPLYLCPSIKVVTLTDTIVSDLAHDSTHVYAVGERFFLQFPFVEGVVLRVPKAEPTTPLFLARDAGKPARMALHEAVVFFTHKGSAPGIGQTMATGDGGPPEILVAGQVAPSSIAVDPVEIFWTNEPESGDVWRTSRASPSDASVFAPPQDAVSVALDADFVYWTVKGTEGKIMRARRDGSGAAPVVTNAPWAKDLALDADTIYWIEDPPDRARGAVRCAPKSGGPPRTLATNQDKIERIVERGAYVYWALSTSVWRVAKTGGEPLLLAHTAAINLFNHPPITAMTVDATHVYFAVQINVGTDLYRVAR